MPRGLASAGSIDILDESDRWYHPSIKQTATATPLHEVASPSEPAYHHICVAPHPHRKEMPRSAVPRLGTAVCFPDC